jgi:hypothetical protein
MSLRHNTIRLLIEYVLSQNHWHGGWLTTKEIVGWINQMSPLNQPGAEASVREVRLKLHTLFRDGLVHRSSSGRGYSWKWRP